LLKIVQLCLTHHDEVRQGAEQGLSVAFMSASPPYFEMASSPAADQAGTCVTLVSCTPPTAGSLKRIRAIAANSSPLSPDHPSKTEVGAFAVGSNGSGGNETCATDLETSADFTNTSNEPSGRGLVTVATVGFPSYDANNADDIAALAIAAEVAPEMLDLERSITERVRGEVIEEQARNILMQ
jgi:hypothetical protein